jgi:adenosylcobinamide-phosphate synthase
MNFFAVLLALLLEQLKPLPRGNVIHDALTSWMRWAGRNFDAGAERHAWVVWSITVAAPALLIWGVYAGVGHFSLILALGFDVAVLYLTLGFRQFSHYFTDIRDALASGDEAAARQHLARWRRIDASELPRAELLRHVIEHSLLAAHRHVFGVFFWFVALSTVGLGPAGAVLYRLAEFSSRYWAHKSRHPGVPVNPHLISISTTLFALMDFIPARMTAFGFAVVGNFEEAVTCWRRDAALWKHANEGIILSAAAGAVGVRLGGSAEPAAGPAGAAKFGAGDAAELVAAEGSTTGELPQSGHLGSVVGLVWRSVVLWMLLLAVLTLANLVG